MARAVLLFHLWIQMHPSPSWPSSFPPTPILLCQFWNYNDRLIREEIPKGGREDPLVPYTRHFGI